MVQRPNENFLRQPVTIFNIFSSFADCAESQEKHHAAIGTRIQGTFQTGPGRRPEEVVPRQGVLTPCRARRKYLKRSSVFCLRNGSSQDDELALTALFVPNPLDSGHTKQSVRYLLMSAHCSEEVVPRQGV